MVANFEALPFAAGGSDSESDGEEVLEQGGGAAGVGEGRPEEVHNTPPNMGADETNQAGGGAGAVGGAGSDASVGGTGSNSVNDPVSLVPAAEGVVLNLAQNGPAVRVLKAPAPLSGLLWLLTLIMHLDCYLLCISVQH